MKRRENGKKKFSLGVVKWVGSLSLELSAKAFFNVEKLGEIVVKYLMKMIVVSSRRFFKITVRLFLLGVLSKVVVLFRSSEFLKENYSQIFMIQCIVYKLKYSRG